MHETERHRIIAAAVQSRPVATVADLVEMTGASEATIRRDIASMHVAGKLRRVRGGAESVTPLPQSALAGRPYKVNETMHAGAKRAIARAAADMIADGDSIIINGGTTTFQMVHHMSHRRAHVFTNSFPIAAHLLAHSRSAVMVPGGTIYREQNIILSPFDNDTSKSFYASRMFISCQGVGPLGLMETDPMLIQAELKLIDQADELICLADSSKLRNRSSLILCGLDRVSTLITDRGITEEEREMVAGRGVRLIVADADIQDQSARTA
ncbi:DeoR family transcriptional regulator [Devosia pacifica]|uniref:DeoR family transcriptional regulator n=1 Tax=Devosia pacifica TaxID=1335967 RepID=A0A918VU89_9HYPH|nr:DeoR/GlpR family DNA-binding transcription regulator [Devosia pacifica]GHA29708.1 DeoR family transcriptional regulator [Devosia pacifica]